MKHIMLDAETLGVTANAVVMSLGAVKFDLESDAIDDEGFYASISIESNLDAGRVISEDTLVWWMKEDPRAQAVFHEEKTTLAAALADLSDWFGSDDYFVWSDGASFDIPMLEHAYSQLKMEAPWKFFNSRCLPIAKGVKRPASGVPHHALHDAINQAKYAQAIWAAMKVAA